MNACPLSFLKFAAGFGRGLTRNHAVKAAVLAATMAIATAQAQYTINNDELLLGFTMPSSTGDLVVDLGAPSKVGVGGTNVVDLTTNGSLEMSAAALKAQLNGLYGNMNDLSWGVVGGHHKGPVNGDIYFTVPHGQAPPLAPGSFVAVSDIDTVGSTIVSGNQAVDDPTQQLGDSWSEAIAPGTGRSSFYIDFGVDPNLTTPAGFSSGLNYQVADLYLTSSSLTNVVLQGSFTLGSDGSFTFTPASSVVTPPPPPLASIKRLGNTSTISFGTTNGAVYSLYYTNTAGLSRPVSMWAVSGSTVTGNGQTTSLSDTTTDANRVYRVMAH